MKFLKLLETAWLAAIVIALLLGTYNAITLGNFSYHVYTPYVCAVFCGLIFYNIRRQRLFLEKMEHESKQKPVTPQPENKV